MAVHGAWKLGNVYAFISNFVESCLMYPQPISNFVVDDKSCAFDMSNTIMLEIQK